ncbi:hypothetical protein, partial [Desulfobacter postgatei]|uniref:hypothetical protein n=1 Tax=Desulfobacter postgatei TaxID=2293 RepID=UPI00259B4419
FLKFQLNFNRELVTVELNKNLTILLKSQLYNTVTLFESHHPFSLIGSVVIKCRKNPGIALRTDVMAVSHRQGRLFSPEPASV